MRYGLEKYRSFWPTAKYKFHLVRMSAYKYCQETKFGFRFDYKKIPNVSATGQALMLNFLIVYAHPSKVNGILTIAACELLWFSFAKSAFWVTLRTWHTVRLSFRALWIWSFSLTFHWFVRITEIAIKRINVQCQNPGAFWPVQATWFSFQVWSKLWLWVFFLVAFSCTYCAFQ